MDEGDERLFVLRLWEEPRTGGQGVTRVSLFDPATGTRLHFATLAALLRYLGAEPAKEPGPESGPHLQS